VSILDCKKCGYRFTYPFLTDKQLPTLYEKYYPRGSENAYQIKHQNPKLSLSLRFKHFIDGTSNQGQFIAKSGDKFLDVGAGSCGSALQAKLSNCDVWTIEADPTSKVFAEEFGLTHHTGMLSNAPSYFSDFDIISFNQVLEHVTNPDREIINAKLRLKDSGLIFISVPNSKSLVARLSGSSWINWHVPFHVSHFNKNVLKSMLQKHDLKIQKIYTKTPNLWLKIQVLRYLGLDKIYIWDRQKNSQSSRNTILEMIKRKTLLASLSILTPVIARILDFFGQGESICVIAVKK
jgi:2-polyprenyl-3-methyl-5-hydroxy-6-metoxy-1,4-benzoquinol methylase